MYPTGLERAATERTWAAPPSCSCDSIVLSFRRRGASGGIMASRRSLRPGLASRCLASSGRDCGRRKYCRRPRICRGLPSLSGQFGWDVARCGFHSGRSAVEAEPTLPERAGEARGCGQERVTLELSRNFIRVWLGFPLVGSLQLRCEYECQGRQASPPRRSSAGSAEEAALKEAALAIASSGSGLCNLKTGFWEVRNQWMYWSRVARPAPSASKRFHSSWKSRSVGSWPRKKRKISRNSLASMTPSVLVSNKAKTMPALWIASW
mmetsp:Transcript_108558/g.304036  ORF Transcript_108558/g.304036 Transcript_108558/m.304036 type:complete len:265 (+) Transcript_108558:178-972(+)